VWNHCRCIEAQQEGPRQRLGSRHFQQVQWRVDRQVARPKLASVKSFKSKAVACHANRRARRSGGSPVDDGVADQQRCDSWDSVDCRNMLQSGWVWFPRKKSVSADDRIMWKVTGQVKPAKDLARCPDGFVREHRQARPRRQVFQDVHDPRIGPRVNEQALAVDVEKTIQRVDWRFDAARGKRTRHERRRAVAHHAADAIVGQPVRTARFVQRIGRVRDVASRIDERAVEVEDDQAKSVTGDGGQGLGTRD
jgi:hypothetical protein